MGLIDLNIGGQAKKKGKSRAPAFDARILTRAAAAMCGIFSVLIIVLGFLAAFLAESPGYAMLGAAMICLPIAIAGAIAAVVLWKL